MFRFVLALTSALLAGPGFAESGAPLSVIDWLSDPPSVEAAKPVRPDEPAVSLGAARPNVSVAPLGVTRLDAAGLLAPNVSGFPLDLWRASNAQTVGALLQALDTRSSPIMQRLKLQLLLAEADPPISSAPDGAFLKARLETLAAQGAVEQALALVERAGFETAALFDTYLELAFLSDQTDAACATLAAKPRLTRSEKARIFCVARNGDWPAAYTMLTMASGLGALNAADAQLLELFLDPELAEERAPRPPRRPSALDARIFEALGRPIAPQDLPPGHATRDLTGDAGWKAQLDAGERLVALGALNPARLVGIYGQRKASASGGVWERVSAVQKLERAVLAQDTARVGQLLDAAWPLFSSRRLESVLSAQFASDALRVEGSEIALKIAFLSPGYEAAVEGAAIALPFEASVARGAPSAPNTAREMAVARGFSEDELPDALARLKDGSRLGELILRGMSLYIAGQLGDPLDVTTALKVFRAVGLEDVARRAALEYLILERGA